MCNILSFLLLSAFSASADASLAALKALDKAASTGGPDLLSYFEPEVTCQFTLGSVPFGPEKTSPTACVGKINAALTGIHEGYMLTSYDPTPVSETCDGSTCVATYSISGCKANGVSACVPGTTQNAVVANQYTFDAQDKVSAISASFAEAGAAFELVLSANESAIPVAGICITAFLLSALSIGCYQLGKKHGQTKVSGAYTSLTDA